MPSQIAPLPPIILVPLRLREGAVVQSVREVQQVVQQPPRPRRRGTPGGTSNAASAASMLIALDPAAAEPLHRQIYRGVREAILSGRIAPGARIPSTRVLAADLGV